MKPEILILKLGSTFSDLKSECGDFEDWIAEVADSGTSCRTLDMSNEITELELSNADGLILTGSHSSVFDEEKWIESVKVKLRELLEESLPVLGICFGHQILAELLGGRVIRNPAGPEIGTRKVSLTPSGKKSSLFDNIPDSFPVFESHSDIVVSLPDECQILAFNEMSSIQAFCTGNIYGVQFHPEFNPRIMKHYMKKHSIRVGKEVYKSDTDFTLNHQVLKNFITRIVRT